MLHPHSKPFLAAEFLLLMLVLPAALTVWLPPKLILPVVWALAFFCYRGLRVVPGHVGDLPWNRGAVNWQNLKPILQRFALNAALLVGLTLWLKPELFLGFVRQTPAFWALVMVLYPLLSVVAQEIIFRVYFFARYGALFTRPWALVAASALAFGFAHLLFQNWVAPLLCTVGGALFAVTYRRTGSLALVALEHALYGDFLFTLGLGRYFYHGAVGINAAPYAAAHGFGAVQHIIRGQ